MTFNRIHFIGIGGIGVSALAGILHKKGKSLSGSDQQASATTRFLEKTGIKFYLGHDPKNIKRETDLVIYSLAVSESNPELQEAVKRKIPVMSYPEALGEFTKGYYTIAVCGTHGKSTITSFIAKILIENNFDPTVIVGTKIKELDGNNFRVGKSKLLVLEACEYRRAFLNYNPKVIVLHTLDPDHLDYYKDFNDYLSAFKAFAAKLPADGYLFGNLDDEDVHDILQAAQSNKFPASNTFTYSTLYSDCNFHLCGNTVMHRDKEQGVLRLKIPGLHNRTNALAAYSVGSILGIATKNILNSINNYKGADRRFEIKGKIGRTIVIDDYAHHPTEIKATLQAAREMFPKKKICVVFQPHQYSRTKNLLREFGEAFAKSDFVIIPNIYEARDTKKDKMSVSPEILVNEISKNHQKAIYGRGLEETIKHLRANAKNFSVIITMGAGDVWKIADKLI